MLINWEGTVKTVLEIIGGCPRHIDGCTAEMSKLIEINVKMIDNRYLVNQSNGRLFYQLLGNGRQRYDICMLSDGSWPRKRHLGWRERDRRSIQWNLNFIYLCPYLLYLPVSENLWRTSTCKVRSEGNKLERDQHGAALLSRWRCLRLWDRGSSKLG